MSPGLLRALPVPPLPPRSPLPLCLSRISVALCTYNGIDFLPEQLQSIVTQSQPPGELVVFDDGSTDGTLALLQKFASDAPFPVHVHQNPHRYGPAANFGRAIAAATGDVIVLCDQDDLWHPHRLSITQDAFAQEPRPGLVFSNADVCDATGRPLGYTLWKSLGFPTRLRRRAHRRGFDVLLRQNVAAGATMAFDARFRPLILPIDPHWMHDGWIALLIAAVAPVVAIDRPLIRYRQHATQTIGALRRSFFQQYRNARAMHRDVFQQHADMYAAALDRLSETPGVAPEHLDRLRAKVHHLQRRSRIRRRETTRLLPSLAELLSGRYRHFSLGWKSFAQDLLL